MRILLNILLFSSLCFGNCSIILDSTKDIVGADFIDSKLALFDTKKLLIKNTSKFDDLFSYTSQANNIISAKLLGGGDLLVSFDDKSVKTINLNSTQDILDPLKTKINQPFNQILLTKDKAIFLSKNHAIVYDFINRIYKSKTTNLNSKIIDSKIDENSVFIACFDRNLYELNLGDFSINKIANLPNLITKVEILDNKPLASMIDGKIWYKNQIYEISKNKISAIKVGQNALYFGDSKSNLIISDLNFHIKKQINLKADEIKELFIDSSNLLVVMWNRAIYNCNLKSIHTDTNF